MFTAGRIMRSAQRPTAQRPSCSSPSGELLPGQSSFEAPEKVQLHLYNMPSANFHVYRQQQLELEKEKKSLLEAAETQQKQFYVPFIWQALLATIIGLIIISIGITLCVLGYEAENRQTSRKQILESRRAHQANKTRHVTNADDKITDVIPRHVSFDNSSIKLSINCTRDCPPKTSDQTLDLAEDTRLAAEDSRLKYLIYLGPVIMSCGSFAIVFSCVVVCETRDRVLQLLEKRRKQLEAMATGNNRQELLANIEQHLLSSSISLASNEDQPTNDLQSNINRQATLQASVDGEPTDGNQIRQSSNHPKLKIDVFTKSLIRSQLRNKLTALVDTKLET